MKVGWQTKSLEDICQFSNGLWKGEKPPYVNIGVIRNTNFTKEGMLDDSDIAFLDVEERKYEKRRLKFGDIILEKSGGGPKQPVGRVALFDKNDGDYSFSNFTSALRVLEPRELDFRFLHKFLYWTYLSGVTEGMQSHSTGIRNLDGNAYKAIKISFPPLPEQQRIVKLLDNAFEGLATAKANSEKNLLNARALFESYLNSVFTKRGEGWESKRISDLSMHTLGKMLDKAKNKGELKPYLRNLSVRWFSFDLSDLLLMRFSEEEIEKYSAIKGDVLVCEGGYPGRAAIWEKDEPILIQKALHRVRFVIQGLNRWFVYFLYSQDKSGELHTHFTGTGIQHFTGETLGNYVMPIPPELQLHELVDKFDRLFAETQYLENVYQRKLDALENLKKSLLHQAFQGEL